MIETRIKVLPKKEERDLPPSQLLYPKSTVDKYIPYMEDKVIGPGYDKHWYYHFNPKFYPQTDLKKVSYKNV
jgi:hypothetical protein